MISNIIEMTTATQLAVRTSPAHRSAFASQGGVSAVAAVQGLSVQQRLVDMTQVWDYVRTAVAADKGAFPGTSAWSPPI